MSLVKRYLFFLLILFLPTQLAFHFWPPNSYIGGVRIDYLSPTVYLTDLLALVLAVFEFQQIVPIIHQLNTKTFKLTLILILINILNSQFPLLTFLHWLNIFVYSFVLFVSLSSKRLHPSDLKLSLILSALAISLIGIGQFATSQSLGGIIKYLGERPLYLSSTVIAKVSFEGTQHLRAYSVLPHPNALAGYLVVLFFIIACLHRLEPRHYKMLTLTTMFTSSVCLLLTFSVSGLLAVVLACLIYFFKFSKTIFKTGLIFLIGTLVLVSAYFIRPTSIQERVKLAQASVFEIPKHLFIGTGFGVPFELFGKNIIPGMNTYQPVHNLYLILLLELGLPLTIILTFLLYHHLSNHNVPIEIKTALILICFLGLFDHYWITSHQNILLILLTVFLTNQFQKSKKNKTAL